MADRVSPSLTDAYAAAIEPSSPRGTQINETELETIAKAYKENAGTSILGFKFREAANRTDFLKSMVDKNPALATALMDNKSYFGTNGYMDLRMQQEKPGGLEAARAALRQRLDMPDPIRSDVSELPEDLAARARQLNDGMKSSAREIDSSAKMYKSIHDGRVYDDAYKSLVRDVRARTGMNEPKARAAVDRALSSRPASR